MFLEAVILALVIGWLRGGRLKRLLSYDLKGLNWILLALSVRYLIQFLSWRMDFFLVYGGIIQIAAYIILFWGLWQSLEFLEIKMVGLGSLANFVVIATNGGKMPVSSSAVASVGVPLTETGTHALLEEGTRFFWLADIIPLPPPYLFPMVISIGDILIVLGVMLLIQNAMLRDTRPAGLQNDTANWLRRV